MPPWEALRDRSRERVASRGREPGATALLVFGEVAGLCYIPHWQMKVARLDVSRYRIPLRPPVADSTHGIIRDFALITVVVRTDDGLEGIGYTYTVGHTGGAAIASLITDLIPVLVGKDPRRVEALWQAMWAATHYVGRGGPASFAISAIDIALWDLKAKRLHEPLWRLLGGNRPKVRAYAGGIDLNLPINELEEQTYRHLQRGFRAIKMKVGLPRLSDDLERVKAIRELIGSENALLVDANMKWTVEEAVRASRALAEHDVYWLEEPTSPVDVRGHVRIQREGPLPVAAGENLHTLDEFDALISAGGVAFPEPDVSNCGGITPWMKVAHLAEARHLPVTSHGVHDLHVSLLAAVPNASFLEVHGFGLDPYLTNTLSLSRDGYAEASDRPGHGLGFRGRELAAHIEK